jgi:hypothetical protein
MARISSPNAAYELQCKLGTLINKVQEWAYIYWVQPVYGRPYFVSKKSELGLFLAENWEYTPVEKSEKTTAQTIRPVSPDFLITMPSAVEGTIFLCSTLKGRSVFFKLDYENRKVNGAVGGSWNARFKCWEYLILGTVSEALSHVDNTLKSAGIETKVYIAKNP